MGPGSLEAPGACLVISLISLFIIIDPRLTRITGLIMTALAVPCVVEGLSAAFLSLHH